MPSRDNKKNQKDMEKNKYRRDNYFFFFFVSSLWEKPRWKKVEKRIYGEFKTDEFHGLDILEVFLIVY